MCINSACLRTSSLPYDEITPRSVATLSRSIFVLEVFMVFLLLLCFKFNFDFLCLYNNAFFYFASLFLVPHLNRPNLSLLLRYNIT